MSENKIILTTLSIISIILLSSVIIGVRSFDSQKNKINQSSTNLASGEISKFPESLTVSTPISENTSVAALSTDTLSIASKSTEISNLDKLSQNTELSEFVNLVKASETENQINSADPITLFAPNNESFKFLAEGTLQNLKLPKNKELLKTVIQNHIFKGKATTEQLKNLESITTTNDITFATRVDGEYIFINDIAIVAPDKQDSNLIVHTINRVNLGY